MTNSREKKERIHPCPKFMASQIKYWRKKRGLIQQEAAKRAGVKFRHFQEIESGRVDMKVRTLGAIARGLDVTPQRLLTPVQGAEAFMCSHCLDQLPGR